ncbi:extracellular solute-binding protein, partial [Dolichospermum sp. ST_sed4]|nr:extracellular solute-binding protein [Dolichospermum sp. ST_sed4]
GLLVCLDEYIPKGEIDDYLKIPLAYNYYNGKLWGIPQVTDCLALLYNKRIFRDNHLKVPQTMDEFASVAQKLTVDNLGKTPIDKGFNPDEVVRY